MTFFIINGPNMNLLGLREPELYGHTTYSQLCAQLTAYCNARGVECTLFQSNHEGALIDAVQKAFGEADGIVLNPAAYTHTSIALADAVRAVGIPTVEVHITDTSEREDFRKISFVRDACVKTIQGHGVKGYFEAVDELLRYVKNEDPNL